MATIEREASHIHVTTETSEKMKINNGWSTILENEVKSMSELSKAYSWMHFKSARLYKKYNNRITILTLIITTALMLPNLVEPSTVKDKIILRIFNVLMTIVVAFLTSFNNLKNYAGRSQSHREAGEQFSRIHDTIRQELLYYRKDRHHADEFIEYQSQILDIYVSGSPDIEDNIVKIFKKKFNGVKINIPNFMNDNINQFDLISPVEIHDPKRKSMTGFTNTVSPLRNNKMVTPTPGFVESNIVESKSEQKLNIGLEEDEQETDNDEDEESKTVSPKYLTSSKFRIEMNKLNKKPANKIDK